MKTTALQKEFGLLLTTRDLVDAFGTTEVTIYKWRQIRGLPFIILPGRSRDSIRFVKTDVEAWANQLDLKIDFDKPKTHRRRGRGHSILPTENKI
jgi:hypothetical protein